MNAVLWWLCQNTLAVALMIPVVLLLCRAFRSRPAVQHAFWLVLLIKLMMPPIVDSPWSVESLIAMWQPAVDVESPSVAAPPLLPVVQTIAVAPSSAEGPMESVPPHEAIRWRPTIGESVVVLWGVGCVFVLVVQLRRIVRHRTLIRTGTAAPINLVDEIGRVSSQMGLRPIRAVVVRHIASPFVWCFGWLRLVWPESLLGEVNSNRSRGIIAHELAHVRRRDHWVAWLELAAGLVWWWNPVFWFVRGRLRESAELACDALAISTRPEERRAYAEMFLELSSDFKSGTPVPVLGMSTGAPSSFERRLAMILCERVSGKMSWGGFALAGLLAALAAPSWTFGQSARPQPLSEFERRLLNELQQKELDAKAIDEPPVLKAPETKGDKSLTRSEKSQVASNRLDAETRQVRIKVVVAEVSAAAARWAGLNFAVVHKDSVRQLANPATSSAPGACPVFIDNGQALAQIKTLQSLSYARSLAEPNLTTLNGMPANFQAGGQIHVPIVTENAGDGQRLTRSVPIGISLKITPQITEKDRIRLPVSFDHTTKDWAKDKKNGGVLVPELTLRHFESTVELKEGQSMVIFGVSESGNKTDAASDFEKTRLKEIDKTLPGEVVLVLVVTPEIVHPMPERNNAGRPREEESERSPRFENKDNSGKSPETSKTASDKYANDSRALQLQSKIELVEHSLARVRRGDLKASNDEKKALFDRRDQLNREMFELALKRHGASGPGRDQLALRLQNVQAADIAKTLVDLFTHANSQDFVIVAEPSSNTLFVSGTAAQQEAIRLIVDQLETAATVNRPVAPRFPVAPPSLPTK